MSHISDPGPLTRNAVGDYHTHGGPEGDGDEDFSEEKDIKNIIKDSRFHPGYKGYLGTPNGAFKSFDPATGRIENLPYPGPNDACRCTLE
jgi:hypothetical protein